MERRGRRPNWWKTSLTDCGDCRDSRAFCKRYVVKSIRAAAIVGACIERRWWSVSRVCVRVWPLFIDDDTVAGARRDGQSSRTVVDKSLWRHAKSTNLVRHVAALSGV